jgi:hypothetical protein
MTAPTVGLPHQRFRILARQRRRCIALAALRPCVEPEAAAGAERVVNAGLGPIRSIFDYLAFCLML